MKVLWIVLGVMLCLCLVCAGGGYFLVNKARTVLDDAGKYGDESFRAIATKWDASEFQKRVSPELASSKDGKSIPDLMSKLSGSLGPMKTFTSHLMTINTSNNNGVSSTTATWVATSATFEKGDGLATMQLINHGNKWEILSFEVSSSLLVTSGGSLGVSGKVDTGPAVTITSGGTG